MINYHVIANVGYSTVYRDQVKNVSYFRGAGKVVAAGSPRAYGPAEPLDYLSQAKQGSGPYHKVVVNQLGPVKQTDDQPIPGNYVSKTSLQNLAYIGADQRRYVDSEEIPYIAIPENPSIGAEIGDLAYVIYPKTGRATGAVVGDHSPAGTIGAVSIAAAEVLEINPDPKEGGVGFGVIYITFNASKLRNGFVWPMTAETIQQKALTLFKEWGGLRKVQEAFPEVNLI